MPSADFVLDMEQDAVISGSHIFHESSRRAVTTWLVIVPDITRTTSPKPFSRREHTGQTHVIEEVIPLSLGTRFPARNNEASNAIPTFQEATPSSHPENSQSSRALRRAFSLPPLAS